MFQLTPHLQSAQFRTFFSQNHTFFAQKSFERKNFFRSNFLPYPFYHKLKFTIVYFGPVFGMVQSNGCQQSYGVPQFFKLCFNLKSWKMDSLPIITEILAIFIFRSWCDLHKHVCVQAS